MKESSRGLEPRRGRATRKAKRSACLSHAPEVSGDPPPNSPACSPRRERRRVFRALFPACDVFPRIVRPSCPGLRPGNNGDSLRLALDRHWKGFQAHSPHSGDRQARPRPGKAAAGLHRSGGREPSSREKNPEQSCGRSEVLWNSLGVFKRVRRTAS
jgi:hypothetical protein